MKVKTTFYFRRGKKSKKVDAETLASTALIMLVAGYDTTAQTMSYLAYTLAMNPDIQERLYEEVSEAFRKNDGKMPSYNELQDLEYLDMVIHETLRYYPALGMVTRVVTEECELPGYPEIKLKKDVEVHFNAAGIHKDPDYYPNPEVFDPERFSKEEKAKRHPYEEAFP